MRRIILFLMIMSVIVFASSEGGGNSSAADSIPATSLNNETIAKTLLDLKTILENQIEEDRCIDRYELYPTTNMYNFIKLDTRTGILSLVQWSLEDGKEGEYTLNNESLVNKWNDYGCGSFVLYPTTNMYQFILLNKTNGKQWHVQWGFEKSKRWIRRIY